MGVAPLDGFRLTRPTVAMVALSVCLTMVGCGTAWDKAGGQRPVEPTVLTLLFPLNRWESQPFIDAVARLSNGTLRIERLPVPTPGQPSSDVDGVRAVQAGQADLGMAPVRAWPELGVHSFDPLVAPLAIDSFAVQHAVLASDVVEPMLAGTATVGVTGIGVLPGPLRHPVAMTTALTGPQDYEGRTIGLSDGAVASRSIDALGAKPQPIRYQEQRAPVGVDGVDGLEAQLEVVDGNRYDSEAQAITSNVTLWPRPLVLVGNPARLAELDESHRQVLRQAARSAVDDRVIVEREQEALANLCRRGGVEFVHATPAELAWLRRAIRPVLTWLRQDAAAARALGRIDAIRAEVASAGTAEAAPSCTGIEPGSSAPSTSAFSLDGVYRMTSTAEDLRAIGTPPGDVVPENYGEWVFVVAGDRFAFTQENDEACTWGFGSWSVAGDIVQWHMGDGGGVAPNGAENRPGEVFQFHWSLYQDTLTLTGVPGAISPENFRARPWHRSSRVPDRAVLNPRCPPAADALPGL